MKSFLSFCLFIVFLSTQAMGAQTVSLQSILDSQTETKISPLTFDGKKIFSYQGAETTALMVCDSFGFQRMVDFEAEVIKGQDLLTNFKGQNFKMIYQGQLNTNRVLGVIGYADMPVTKFFITPIKEYQMLKSVTCAK